MHTHGQWADCAYNEWGKNEWTDVEPKFYYKTKWFIALLENKIILKSIAEVIYFFFKE